MIDVTLAVTEARLAIGQGVQRLLLCTLGVTANPSTPGSVVQRALGFGTGKMWRRPLFAVCQMGF